MTPAPFSVHTTTAFDREFRKLAKHHRDLIEHYRNTLVILANEDAIAVSHCGFAKQV